MLETSVGGGIALQRAVRNRVLCTLQPNDFARISPLLKRVELSKNRVVFDAGRDVDAVYFVESGIVSGLATTASDRPVEVLTTGRFGFVGVSIVLDSSKALHRFVVLVAGTALRIGADDLRRAMCEHPSIRTHLLRYAQVLIRFEGQLVLCTARHSIHQRLARWLLLAEDLLDGEELRVTHDRIARALGVRRSSVSAALADFQVAGMISKHRGAATILRRDLLLAQACRCYGIISRMHGAIHELPRFLHCAAV